MTGGPEISEGREYVASTPEEIEALQRNVAEVEQKISATVQRNLAMRKLPAAAQNANWGTFDRDYSTLIEGKMELFLISGTPEALQQEFDAVQPPFSPPADKQIQSILDLFEIKSGNNGDYSVLLHRANETTHVKAAMLNTHIQELTEIKKRSVHPSQQAFTQNLIDTLQGLIDMDNLAKKDLDQYINAEPSKLGKLGKYGKFFGGTLLGGLAIFGLVANKGRPNLATLLYLGLGYLLFKGLPKGAFASHMKQIEFLRESNFEQLADDNDIQGQEWADFMLSLTESSVASAKAKLKSDLKRAKSPEEYDRLQREFAEDLASGASNPARDGFLALTFAQQESLISWAQSVKTADAKQDMTDFIRDRTNVL